MFRPLASSTIEGMRRTFTNRPQLTGAVLRPGALRGAGWSVISRHPTRLIGDAYTEIEALMIRARHINEAQSVEVYKRPPSGHGWERLLP